MWATTAFNLGRDVKRCEGEPMMTRFVIKKIGKTGQRADKKNGSVSAKSIMVE